MDGTEKISEAVHMTALVLANAAELTAAIIGKIAGNDISTAVNGSPLTREMIKSLAIQNMANKLAQ